MKHTITKNAIGCSKKNWKIMWKSVFNIIINRERFFESTRNICVVTICGVTVRVHCETMTIGDLNTINKKKTHTLFKAVINEHTIYLILTAICARTKCLLFLGWLRWAIWRFGRHGSDVNYLPVAAAAADNASRSTIYILLLLKLLYDSQLTRT